MVATGSIHAVNTKVDSQREENAVLMKSTKSTSSGGAQLMHRLHHQ